MLNLNSDDADFLMNCVLWSVPVIFFLRVFFDIGVHICRQKKLKREAK